MINSKTIASGKLNAIGIGAITLAAVPPVLLVVNLLTELAWPIDYSWASNNISDLGNVGCGFFDGRDICSPMHLFFNAGVIVLGCLVGAGVILVRSAWGRGRRATLARGCILLAATGYVLAGVFPADVNLGMHLLAALLVMPIANIGLLASGFVRRDSVIWKTRWTARALGAAAFIASYLHFAGPWLGIGKGGMERIAVFTLLFWLGGIGIFLLRTARNSGRGHQ
jgi:hypothetical membrane protein